MSADLFDVYGDFRDAVAVPLEQAIQEFQKHWGPDFLAEAEQQRQEHLSGTSTVEKRKAVCEARHTRSRFLEVQLFRSIMAAGYPHADR